MLKIKTTNDKLLGPLQQVTGIVERRHTLPILSNVLVSTGAGKVHFLATDLEVQITSTAELEGNAEGTVTAGARKSAKMVPFLELLSDLIRKKVEIRLLHAKEPGPAFRKDFDAYPNLIDGMERILCPRVHFKSVIVDGTFAYTGSANLTGAGIGAKGETKRNFESGIITDLPPLIDPIMTQFDDVWRGKYCKPCRRKKYCADYRDLLAK
jgi:hypothetical protein